MSESRDKLIRDALDTGKESNDLSLRGKSWSRALTQRPPKTMTAWEWEEWYAQHGVPASHRQTSQVVWWQRLLSRLMPAASPARGE